MQVMKKTIIDDGFYSELVETAQFAGIHEIPILECPENIIIPSGLIPYSQINKTKDHSEFIHFYEHDIKFRDIITSTGKYYSKIKEFAGVISPDCSLYRDMPLVLQFANTYMNRAVGYYLQHNGIYTIPNVRWGDERSFTNEYCGEKVAFLGIPKNSIVSIGTYGCIKSREDRYFFKAGLAAMLEELTPQVVLVYGSMPESVFGNYSKYTTFYRFPDWISQKRKKVT